LKRAHQYGLSIWKILYWHNKRRWRSTLSLVWTQVFSLAILFYCAQMFIGVTHFYAVVSDAIAHAKIIHLTANGNYAIVPADGASWSFWKPGDQLVITSAARDTMNTINFLFTRILTFVGGAFFFKAIWDSRQQSRLEMEARSYKYTVWLRRTLNPKLVMRIASLQKLVFNLVSIGIAIPLSMFLLVPLSLFTIEREIPGISVFFRLSLQDVGILSTPLLFLILAGYVFTRRRAAALLRELI